jgi:hypothetical protein
MMLGGCSPQDPSLVRLGVSGLVTIVGTDTAVNGIISFLPEAGNDGPAASASIVNGEYRFNKTNGPVAGKYKVVVVPRSGGHGARKLPAAGASVDAASDKMIDQEFTAMISADDLTFDFDLK